MPVQAACPEIAMSIQPVESEEPSPSTMVGRSFEDFMSIPTVEEKKACYREFIAATSNDALAMSICVVCARELSRSDGK